MVRVPPLIPQLVPMVSCGLSSIRGEREQLCGRLMLLCGSVVRFAMFGNVRIVQPVRFRPASMWVACFADFVALRACCSLLSIEDNFSEASELNNMPSDRGMVFGEMEDVAVM